MSISKIWLINTENSCQIHRVLARNILDGNSGDCKEYKNSITSSDIVLHKLGDLLTCIAGGYQNSWYAHTLALHFALQDLCSTVDGTGMWEG